MGRPLSMKGLTIRRLLDEGLTRAEVMARTKATRTLVDYHANLSPKSRLTAEELLAFYNPQPPRPITPEQIVRDWLETR